MKKRILMVFSILLILVGLFVLIKVTTATLSPKGRGALQITTNIRAQVYLNDKSIGPAPLCLCDAGQTITEGIYDIKIVPDDKTLQPFVAKVNINTGVLTAVERTFLPGALGSSYILTLERNPGDPQIFIATVPDNALITIDGDSKGATPFTQSLSESEHEVEIEKAGFSKKTVRVRAVKNYKLVLNAILGAEGGADADTTPTPTPSINTTPAIPLSPTPTPAPKNSVTILDTPTGFLRVRQTPSVAGAEIGRVNPGEVYEFTDQNDAWYQIKLKDGSTGWISKTYAKESTQ